MTVCSRNAARALSLSLSLCLSLSSVRDAEEDDDYVTAFEIAAGHHGTSKQASKRAVVEQLEPFQS